MGISNHVFAVSALQIQILRLIVFILSKPLTDSITHLLKISQALGQYIVAIALLTYYIHLSCASFALFPKSAAQELASSCFKLNEAMEAQLSRRYAHKDLFISVFVCFSFDCHMIASVCFTLALS